MAATQPTTSTQASASPLDRHAAPVGARAGGGGRSTAALVLGILGVLLALFFAPVGVIVGIIAIVLGQTSRNDCARAERAAPWQATAGFVLGIVAIVVAIAVIAAGVAMS